MKIENVKPSVRITIETSLEELERFKHALSKAVVPGCDGRTEQTLDELHNVFEMMVHEVQGG